MKKNLGMFILAPRFGVGAVLLALCAFTPLSRADVIVDNTGATTGGTVFGSSGNQIAQVFTMSGTSGNISSLALLLDSTTAGTYTLNVDLYATLLGAPTGLATFLGTVTASTTGDRQLIGVSSLTSGVTLTPGTQYAVALEQNGVLRWDYTATPGVGPVYYSSDAGSSWTAYGASGNMQMNLQTTPVPEVPMTGAVMGFGVLAIAVGSTLRRKTRPAVSSIA
jgi:hypothetical protein